MPVRSDYIRAGAARTGMLDRVRILVDPSARVAVSPGVVEIFEPTALPLGEIVAEWLGQLDPSMIEAASFDAMADLGQSATASILATLAAMAREQLP